MAQYAYIYSCHEVATREIYAIRHQALFYTSFLILSELTPVLILAIYINS